MVEDLPANAGDARDTGLIPGLGRSPRGGNDNPLPYSCLGNPTDRWAWRATVYRVMKESDMPEHTHIYLTYIFIILGDSGGGLTLIQSIVMVKLNSKMLLFFFPRYPTSRKGRPSGLAVKKKKKRCDQTNISSLCSRGCKSLQPDLLLAFRSVLLPFTTLKNP